MYEWLSSFQELEQRIAFLDWKLEKYKAELRRWQNPSDLGQYSIVKESKSANLESIIAGLECDMAIEMNHLRDLKKVIYAFRGLDQHILRMKYINGLNLKEIASELGYTYEYIRRKHSEILRCVEFKKDVALGK